MAGVDGVQRLPLLERPERSHDNTESGNNQPTDLAEEPIVEVKATDAVHPIHKAQLLSYMKLLDIPLGLIINFNVLKLTEGVSRLILPGANNS